MIEHALKRLAHIEVERPLLVIGLVVAFTLLTAAGFSRITSETSFESFVPDDVEVIRSLTEIRNKLGSGTTAIILIFRSDPADPQAMTDMRDRQALQSMDIIVQQISQNEFVLSSSSLPDIVKTDGALPARQEINRLIAESPQSGSLIADDYSLAIARFILPDTLSVEQQRAVLEEMRTVAAFADTPPGMEMRFAGPIVQDEEVGRAIGQSTGIVTMLGFLGVFIILFLLFRRPGFVIVSILPIAFGTLWTFGTMGLIGIPMSTALVGVFSMIIGMGIDFSIHIIHRFEEERRNGSLKGAVEAAVTHVGKGLLITSLTTIIGFLALLFATLPILKDMALALSFGIFYSFMATLGLIPPLLVLLERRRGKG